MTFSTLRRRALQAAAVFALATTASLNATAADAILRVSAIPDEAPTERNASLPRSANTLKPKPA